MMMMISFFSWKSHRYTECMGFLEILNEINHFDGDQEHSRKTPRFSPALWPLACEIYLKNNIEISLRHKNELKIELKRLACGKYLVRYPNISTVCLVAVVVISSQCCLFFRSLLIQNAILFMKRKNNKFQVQVENSPSNASVFLLIYQRSEKQSIFWHSQWNQCHQKFGCRIQTVYLHFENRNSVHIHTHTVSVRKESCTFRFFRTDSFDHTYLKQNETDSCFIWNWQRIVWDNGMQPN